MSSSIQDLIIDAYAAYTDWDQQQCAARAAAADTERAMHRAMHTLGSAVTAASSDGSPTPTVATVPPGGTVIDETTMQLLLTHLRGSAIDMDTAAHRAMRADATREHVRLSALAVEASILADRIEILLAGGGDAE